MENTQTRRAKQILAIIVLDKNTLIEGSVPTFLAMNKENQEKIASELAKALRGNVYGLVNGAIIITD